MRRSIEGGRGLTESVPRSYGQNMRGFRRRRPAKTTAVEQPGGADNPQIGRVDPPSNPRAAMRRIAAEAVILQGQCLQLRVEPEDVAALALFLASDNAAKCAGREYYVDAGWYGA